MDSFQLFGYQYLERPISKLTHYMLSDTLNSSVTHYAVIVASVDVSMFVHTCVLTHGCLVLWFVLSFFVSVILCYFVVCFGCQT